MSFEFTESVHLVLPDIKHQLEDINEGETKTNNKIIVEIAAIHEGLTANYNHYSGPELEKSLGSWTAPYPKPIITNHDPDSDPLGRAMAAQMKNEADGTPYIALQAAITSPNAMERLSDKRYLTGSVGGKAGKVLCSVCNVDWAKPSETIPCRHKRGQVYNGKVAYLDMHDISWREYSFVNIPADSNSSVRDMTASESDENESTVKVFTLDLNNESIFELNENDQSENILKNMKKKDAHFTYMNLKGTFLSVSAFDDRDHLETDNSEKSNFIQTYTTIDKESRENASLATTEESNSDEEKNMTTEQTSEITTEDTDDVLAVVDTLSTDLAATDSKEDEDTDTNTEESADDSATETDSDETVSENDGEESVNAEEKEDETLTDTTKVDAAETNSSEDVTTEDNTDEVASLRQTNEALTAENAKFKKAIKSMLVERVVDTKIALGLVEKDDRAEAITEHEIRSASSLADNLRDLAKMSLVIKPVVTETVVPALGNKAVVVGDEKNALAAGTTSEKTVDPVVQLEDFMVDVFMNRKHI